MKNSEEEEVEQVTLRVIDNSEPEVVEEAFEEDEPKVHRLEKSAAPKADPSKKVEARKDRDFLNTMMADTEEEVTDLEDQDAQWIREAEKSQHRAVPFGWFILLIIVFGGVFLWGGFQILTSENSKKTVSSENTQDTGEYISLTEQNLSKEEEAIERQSAGSRYLAMEKTISDYLGADLLENKVKYVRHPERIIPLMKDYYSRQEVEIKEYQSISEYHVVSLENHPFIAIRAELKDGESVALLLEEDEKGFKIDWESEVAYQSYPFDEFLSDRPAGSHDMRLYAQEDRFYAYSFQNEEKWRCYKLTSRDSDEYFFGYVERGSLLESEIFKATGGGLSKGRSMKVPLLLQVSYAVGCRGPRSLMIEAIVSNRWAYATNPEKD
ncbi:hypothetical protein N9051_01390 [Akkermansiaceae bacterium]|nr:hypothetical protein [Akkermansiaceae bacterium]